MQQLTQAKKNALLKQYKDAETVGNTVIKDLLERKKFENEDNTRTYKPILTIEEILFLQQELKLHEQDIFMEYLGLQEGLIKLSNNILLFQESFFHGFYRTLYFVIPLLTGLTAYTQNTEIKNPLLKQICEAQTILINNEIGIEVIWNNYVVDSLKYLYLYDFYIRLLTNLTNTGLEYNILSPKVKEYTIEVKSLQTNILELVDIIHEYQDKTQAKEKEEKVNIPQKTIKLLEDCGHSKIEEIVIPKLDMQIAIELFKKKYRTNTIYFDRFFVTEMFQKIHIGR